MRSKHANIWPPAAAFLFADSLLLSSLLTLIFRNIFFQNLHNFFTVICAGRLICGKQVLQLFYKFIMRNHSAPLIYLFFAFFLCIGLHVWHEMGFQKIFAHGTFSGGDGSINRQQLFFLIVQNKNVPSAVSGYPFAFLLIQHNEILLTVNKLVDAHI
nr:MAG TPA: hypothetical protein [Caudoviricetes sp.]